MQLKAKIKQISLLDDPNTVAGIFKDLLDIKAISPKMIQESFHNEA